MKKWTRVLLIVVMIAGFAMNASAQFIPSVREFTGFGGMTFNGADEGTAGAALAVNISPRIGIEGEGSAIFTNETIINLNADVLFHFGTGTSPIVPYLIGGAGILTNGGTDVALNAGLGLKLFVEPDIAIRIDFRGFFISESGDIEDLERIYGGLIFFF
ncbi:MAG: hypothetical protein RBT80_05500 [Candidatus Vecturithrix sp.]|jgi:hypothetical protein|nr:hypothetical protein [Candidatus Vecturithrix sp.]